MAISLSTLRFYAQGEPLVQNFERLDANISSFVGRRYDLATNKFKSTGEAEEVPNRFEYRKACQDGELAPADAETAKECGVSFDSPKPAVKAEKAA